MNQLEQSPGQNKLANKAIPQFIPFPVNGDLIERAKNGDELAFAEIDGSIRGRLTGYFFLRLPEEAEDLTQIALTNITTRIGRFRFHSDKPIEDQFTYWSYRIAKNVLNTELREVMQRKAIFTPHSIEGQEQSTDAMLSRLHALYARPADQEVPEEQDDLTPEERLDMWIMTNVSERQYYIYEQKNLGRENRDIAKDLKLTPNYVGEEVSAVRQKVEGDLLAPSGFRQAIDFRDASVDGLSKYQINTALTRGYIQSVVILGRHYTSPEYIEEYLVQRKRNQEADTAVEGHVLLSHHVSGNDYSYFLRNPNLRAKLVFDNDRVYIKPDDLKEYQENRGKKKAKREEVPAPEGYSRLTDLATTKKEYSRLRTAYLGGKLPGLKIGSTIFIKPTDASDYKDTNNDNSNP